ncbi:MAG TPA: MFS transporter [Thermoanaerobaculia bacterium]|nr:MFS transporter [Thermoanaerobaculia bacterium]
MTPETSGPASNASREPSPWTREAIAWSFYDFANSAFVTLVVTFIYSAYFARAIASDATHGTILWSRAVNLSALLAALSTPLLGAIADYSGRKKAFLLVSTVVCVVFTLLLFFPRAGQVHAAWILFVVANLGFEAGQVFYNAFLPQVSRTTTIGRISGFGQALGYVGGLLCLVLALGMIRGWVSPEDGLNVRATNILVAVWYALFSIPMFLLVRELPAERDKSLAHATREGFRRLHATMLQLREYREAAKLLLARLIYNDGLVTAFSFAAIFSAAVFGMTTDQIIVLGIVLNVASGAGAFAFGFVNDRIGGKKTITITLVALIVAVSIGAAAESIPLFVGCAIVLGIMVGPNQAASRSLLGLFVPARKRGEFFGFFAFSGKLASIAGPFLYAVMLDLTGSQRWAMGSAVLFFVIGLIVLQFVDEEKGIETGRRMQAV